MVRKMYAAKEARKEAEQKVAKHALLDSFRSAKTLLSPNASRHGSYLELYFTGHGGITSAKVLTYRTGRDSIEQAYG